MRRLGTLASAGVMLAATALAQTTDYTSFDAMPGKPVEIGNYAAVGANCSAGAPPTIKVVGPPHAGTLSVRRASASTASPTARRSRSPPR